MVEHSRRGRVFMETGSLPLVSTFALLTIVAGQLQGSGYNEPEPEFLSVLGNQTVAQGRDVYFTCTVNHLGSYKVAWIKSDTKTILAIHTHMVTVNNRVAVSHNGHNTWKLYIHNVESKDSGTYMCQINTDPMKSQMGYLSVVIPPDITDNEGSEATTAEGGSVDLRCSATGVPPPAISWKRANGKHIVFRDDDGKEVNVVENHIGSTLSLRGLRRADMGSYLCIAANGVPPTKSRQYNVAVNFAPVVRVPRPAVTRALDAAATLQCYVEAYPRPLATWQRGRSLAAGKLLSGTKYSITEQYVNMYSLFMNLTIHRLKKTDFGEYVCSAGNAYGKADGIILLKETPQRTTTTTTSTTTTTTSTTTTTTTTTTAQPQTTTKRRKIGKIYNPNTIDEELRQAFNFYNINNLTPNTSRNEYSYRPERVRPSGPPRVYNNSARICANVLFRAMHFLCIVVLILVN